MSNVMSPSVEQENVWMTDGQIDKATDVFWVSLRKHRDEFKSDIAQQVITAKGLGSDLLAIFRRYAERFGNLIVCIVSVNRARTPEEALVATRRKQYTTTGVVAVMPRGTGKEARVVFFKPDKSAYDVNGLISDDNVAKEYESHDLKPADPFSLCAVNEADPAFADEHPNATHWKDADDNWCCAAFSRWSRGERGVDVNRSSADWHDGWWFAGLAS